MSDRPRRLAFPPLPDVAAVDTGQITDLGSVVLQGDLRSYRWDGGGEVPAGGDGSVSAGFLLDSSSGRIQAQELIAKGGFIADAAIDSLSFDKITAATNTASLVIGAGGSIGSANYSAGSAGFQITGAGDIEANDITARGVLISQAGSDVDWTHLSNVAVENADIVSLSADKITAGTMSSGTVLVDTAVYLDGSGVIATNSSGGRVALEQDTGTTGSLKLYDSGGSVVGVVTGASGNARLSNAGGDLYYELNDISLAHRFITPEGLGSAERLSITDGVRVVNELAVGGSGPDSDFQVYIRDADPHTRALRIYMSTAVATARMADFLSDRGGTASTKAYLQANGSWFNATGGYGTISDRALKVASSIRPARSYLADLTRLPVRKYRSRSKPGHPRQPDYLGFVADEVAEVFPGLVSQAEGEPAAVKTSVLIPMLVTAVQELADRIEALEAT